MRRQFALMGIKLKSTLLSVMGVPALFSAVVSLPAQSSPPGGSIIVPVVFASEESSATALQFDVEYDSSVMSLGVTVGEAARKSDKSLYAADLGPGQKRFVICGLNQTPLLDGIIVNLFVIFRPDAATGLYPLKLSGVVGADPSAAPVPVKSTDASVTVQQATGIILRLQPSGVLNAASLLPGSVAPGEVITLIGAGIGPPSAQQPDGSPASTVLDGTSVAFDGTPAPLLYAAPNQINAIVPYVTYGKSETKLQVITRQGQTVAETSLPVDQAVPAIFTLDASGVGPGAILNQDSTVNTPSNPAEKESVVVLFATGAGQTNPPSADGQVAGDVLPQPLLPVSVQIGGIDATVLYQGAAPTMVAGLLQVNCVVPPNAPSGYSVPVVLFVGPASSPAGVSLAIK
jgi:uncharacterized protein (TIGR03437 family)